MSLEGGSASVTVDASGQPVVVGSGLALAWAEATTAAALTTLPPLPTVGATTPPYRPERPAEQSDVDHAIAARRVLFEDKVRDANAIAPAVVSYLTANAEIVLGNASAQLTSQSVGVTPTPNVAGAAIGAPPAPVSLPVVGTGALQ